MSNKLTMKFEPSTIQHLGLRMYSNLPPALAELIANAYDADATEVKVKLFDEGEEKKIIVEDNGCGMSFNDINNKFLLIGRNRREGGDEKTKKNRFPSGKKGLGKLALFGIGETIEIITKQESQEKQGFSMNWSDIKNSRDFYEPTTKTCFEFDKDHGTTITIRQLKRRSKFDQGNIANSLAKLFHYYAEDFNVSVSVNNTEPTFITNESKFKKLDIEFEWHNGGEKTSFTEGCMYEWDGLLDKETDTYFKTNGLSGKIITTAKPLKPGLRGIALFARGRLINLPEFYGNSDSSHFYAYTMGVIHVDFIDKLSGDDDLIATNRQALNWEHTETTKLKEAIQKLLTKIQNDWRAKRKEKSAIEDKPKDNFDYERWLNSLPKNKADAIRNLLDRKAEDNNTYSKKDLLKALYGSEKTDGIIPEYAEFHWRYLHDELTNNEAIERLYKQGNYYQSLNEAVKLYINVVRTISKSTADTNEGLMGESFKKEVGKGKIQLTNKDTDTKQNIEKGHAAFSRGIVSGIRNPLSHEGENTLQDDKLITKSDCLNILSLISHLMRRLDDRVDPK